MRKDSSDTFVLTSKERYSSANLFLKRREEIFPMPFVLTNSKEKFSCVFSRRYSKILDRKSLLELSNMLLQ